MDGKALIKYIIDKAVHNHKLLSRTALVKIIYLLDYGRLKDENKKLTNYTYDYYYYGPFSQSIIDDLNSLIGKSVAEKVIHFSSGKTMYTYQNFPQSEDIKLENISYSSVIDEKLPKYLNMSLDDLKKLAYDTEPIKNNPKGTKGIM